MREPSAPARFVTRLRATFARPGIDAAANQDELLVELVRMHARIIMRMPWVQSALAICVGVVVLPYVSLAAFLTWCVISIGIEVLRANYSHRLLARHDDFEPHAVHRNFVLWALAAGAAVGCGAGWCFFYLPVADQAVLGIVLFAMPAAGVAVSQSSRYIAAAYCLAILVPASGCWMAIYPHQAFSVGIMTLVYCAFIILVAVEGEQLLLRSVVIRHQRDRLVRDLEQRNADVRIAMQQAEQSALARARVLATASHDLRQPLHALSLYSAVLAAGPAPEQLREVSTNMDQIVRSLGSLLHGLLDLSRLTAGHYEPESVPIELDHVVAAVCNEYRRPAAARGLELITKLAPVRLHGDAVAISRIVRNLLDNAIKYTASGSINVEVSPLMENGAMFGLISVTDTGCGIPTEEQARVFEEFYQLDNPSRDRSRGVGLGLAIVKRLCELIRADISIDSTPQIGTTFTLRIRSGREGADAAGDTHDIADTRDLQGRTVFLVDDEVDILRSTQQLLGAWGMHTKTADGVESARRLFVDGGAPDLFITDLRLRGGESGASLAAELRNTYGNFPVLVITGEISAAAAADVETLGAALLYKPITPELLAREITRAIASSS